MIFGTFTRLSANGTAFSADGGDGRALIG